MPLPLQADRGALDILAYQSPKEALPIHNVAVDLGFVYQDTLQLAMQMRNIGCRLVVSSRSQQRTFWLEVVVVVHILYLDALIVMG